MTRNHSNDLADIGPRLFTVREACERLGLSRTRIDELRRSGAIREVRLGPRGIRFTAAELERFVNAHADADAR